MKILFISLILINVLFASAQLNTWDVPVTEILIGHNKKNYADHAQVRDNQVVLTATVNRWRKTQEDFKNIVNKIDRHLNQAFIIAADITTLYNLYKAMDEMVEYQGYSLQLIIKYPWAAKRYYDKQVTIYQSAVELVQFLFLIVSSYGDINKMQVSSREMIFSEIYSLVNVLKAKCFSLYQMLRQIDLAETYKNTKLYQFLNKDKQIVEDILNQFK